MARKGLQASLHDFYIVLLEHLPPTQAEAQDSNAWLARARVTERWWVHYLNAASDGNGFNVEHTGATAAAASRRRYARRTGVGARGFGQRRVMVHRHRRRWRPMLHRRRRAAAATSVPRPPTVPPPPSIPPSPPGTSPPASPPSSPPPLWPIGYSPPPSFSETLEISFDLEDRVGSDPLADEDELFPHTFFFPTPPSPESPPPALSLPSSPTPTPPSPSSTASPPPVRVRPRVARYRARRRDTRSGSRRLFTALRVLAEGTLDRWIASLSLSHLRITLAAAVSALSEDESSNVKMSFSVRDRVLHIRSSLVRHQTARQASIARRPGRGLVVSGETALTLVSR